jgi:hypothetical protein
MRCHRERFGLIKDADKRKFNISLPDDLFATAFLLSMTSVAEMPTRNVEIDTSPDPHLAHSSRD